MKRRSFLLSLLAGVLFFAPGLAVAQEDPASQLISAARTAGVAIHEEELIVLVHGENTFAAAPIEGFENVPATSLADGADAAFVYIDFPGSEIPAGNYILRARAQESAIQLGGFPGAFDLVNGEGGVVATLPASINAFSLTVPDPLPYPRPVISGAWLTQGEYDAQSSSQSGSIAKARPTRPGEIGSTTGKYISYPWIRDRGGWPVRYVFVRIYCPNGEILEGFVQVP